MMKKIIAICTLGCVVFTSNTYAGGKYVSPAVAVVEPIPVVQSPVPVYLGLGLIVAGLSRDCPCSGTDRLKDLTYGGILRLGWDFNNYFGIEGRVLRGFLEDDFSKTTHYGLYLKPQYHLYDATNIYGLLGYGRTTINYDNHNGRSSSISKNGFSYGAGIEYDLSSDDNKGEYDRAFDGQGDQEEGWGLWADYQHLLNDEGIFNVDSNIFSVGITYDL